MPAPRDHNPRRAAVAKRLKAQQQAPAERVIRSGVDIDAIHHRIPQGGINRDSSAGCRNGGANVCRRSLDITGGQLSPLPQVAAPDDRPHGQAAGAAPTTGIVAQALASRSALWRAAAGEASL